MKEWIEWLIIVVIFLGFVQTKLCEPKQQKYTLLGRLKGFGHKNVSFLRILYIQYTQKSVICALNTPLTFM